MLNHPNERKLEETPMLERTPTTVDPRSECMVTDNEQIKWMSRYVNRIGVGGDERSITSRTTGARSKLPRCREAHYLNHPVDVSEGGAGAAAALLQAEVRAEFPERGQKLRLLRDVGAAALADAVAQLERLVESRLEVLQVALRL